MEVEDGHLLELAVRLPASMPLRAPELECRRKVRGAGAGRALRWAWEAVLAMLLACQAATRLLRACWHAHRRFWANCSSGPWASIHPHPHPPPTIRHLQVGVSEGRLRKWLLSISAFLRMQV